MFDDRADAGRRLVPALRGLRLDDPIVLALPRGGVPVARPISEALHAPLDVLIVRKLGVPRQPELAMGAIGRDVEVLDEDVLRQARISDHDLERVRQQETRELARRELTYRGPRAPARLQGRQVILVDDGVATGSTAMAAVRIARARGASHLVLAVPVLPPAAVRRLDDVVDELVYLEAPRDFHAVGQYYVDFDQTSDREVQEALDALAEAVT